MNCGVLDMGEKVKVATTWLQSCSGCHISLLDLHEELLDVLDLIEIVHSPLMDIKEIPKVTVGLVEGAVANDYNEEVLREMRKQSDILVAFGTCACFGGIPGMRNLHKREDVLARAYVETESTVDGIIPGSPEIPALKQHVHAISDIVKVDYMIPGCPPPPQMIKDAIVALVNGEEIVLPTKNLCNDCKRKHDSMLIPKRAFLTEAVQSTPELDKIDPDKCFLEQGVMCMGHATRTGCGSRCLDANMPCRGCMGPTPDALEQGAKIVNALASILPAGGLMFNEDVVGTGYRYSLPVSIYPHRADDVEEEKEDEKEEGQ